MFVLFLLALLCAGLAYSQAVNATLLGTVTDASGGVVTNAKVTITEESTGVSHTAQTNESGNFTFPDLPPGRYTVSVEMTGFKKEVRRGIELVVDSTGRVDLQLQTGNVSETIEVVATAPALQTDRSDVGRSIDTVAVANLPLGTNRNFQALLNLVPGTAPATWQHSQFFNSGGSLQTEVNGQGRQGNSYQIEGIDDNERTGLLQILVPPAEAIQTVDVSTNNFEAELGRASGGVTNVVLKSGSNNYHGGAYEFLQNSDFDSRSFFNASLGHVAYNYFGGNAGGPIKKNKLFFFADYLRIEDHEANTSLVTIPSMASRTGDLSASPTIVYDPATGLQNGTDAGRTPFPGNQIPSSRINPISAKIAALVPAPNQSYNPSSPSNNYFAALPFRKTQDSVDAKIDYNISDKDRLSGRFSFQRPVVFQAPLFGTAGGDGPGGAFMGTGIQKTYSVGLNYNRVITPTLLTEVRIGVAHYHNDAQPSDFGTNDATNLGIPGVNLSSDPFTSGIVGINLNGPFSNPFIGYSASLPWIRAEANIDMVNSWTKVRGNHTIKWGIDVRRVRDDLLQDQTYSPRGVYNFGSNQTSIVGATTSWGNDMGSFLLDQPSSAGRDLDTYFPAYRDTWFFAFGGDKWQVSPKMTLDLGLRWELYEPGTPHFPGGFSNYNPYTNQLIIAGVGSNPMNLGMATHYKYFAPRLGLAYRLTDKTVVRAGFGISYTPFQDNTYAYNFPVRANNAYNTSSTGNGYGPAVLGDGVTPATFQAGFPAPVPIVIPSSGIITPTGTLASSNFDVVPTDFKNTYAESWNFAVQRSIPGHFTLDVAYVGNHGVRVATNVNLNVSYTLNSGNAGDVFFPRTQSYTERWRGFSSSYNALQVKLDRRYYKGLSVTSSFTWQKGMSMQTDDDGNLLWFINPQRNWARTDFDRTLNFVQSYVYELPIGPGKALLSQGLASRIIGGWQVAGILTMLTGTPFYITANGGALNTPGETQTANQVADVQILHGVGPGNPWFSTASFTQPVGAGVFGTSGRNILSGPGMFRIDLSMFKTFQVSERIKLEVRAESFDLTNTPAFSNPNNSCCSSNNANFGVIQGTINSGSGVNGVGAFGRSLQLGAKITF
ncbi:Cna B domain protein [Candidatus Sulfopaludibacter sp. SbA3]|nr:Cna B domain protein [Candidatus Sulfopaludibacter sp. SbA3]